MNFQRSRTPGRAAGCWLARQCTPMGPVRRAILQDVAERPVGEAEDVVEVLQSVLRVAAGVGPAQDGDGAPRRGRGC